MSENDRKAALEYSQKTGVGFYYARNILRKGVNVKHYSSRLKTSQRHYACPSTWAVWIMAEYRQDLKSFPDWRSIADREIKNKERREEWKSLPVDVRRAKNNHKPKDPKARQEKLNAARRVRHAERPHIRTIDSLRARFRKFITKGQSRSIGKLLGCTLPEFKKHLESQFKRGMTWENYGSKWHIDHVLPCASFDHTDPKQVERCWHYTNMRPLDAIENMRKGKTIKETQMSLLIGFAA